MPTSNSLLISVVCNVYLLQYISLSGSFKYLAHRYQNKELYDQTARWTSLQNGFYNIVTFYLLLPSLFWHVKLLPGMCTWFVLFWLSLAMMAIPMVDNKYVLFLPMVGIGIAWASMMGIPYIMVAACSTPSKTGSIWE